MGHAQLGPPLGGGDGGGGSAPYTKFAELFTGSRQVGAEARVLVNWQAKLVPVTPTRLKEAAEGGKTPEPLRPLLRFAVEQAPGFIAH